MSFFEENTELLQRYQFRIPSDKYLCGFFDGDGTFFIRKIKDGYQSGVTISQSRINLLLILKNHFSGNIYASKSESRSEKIIVNSDGYL